MAHPGPPVVILLAPSLLRLLLLISIWVSVLFNYSHSSFDTCLQEPSRHSFNWHHLRSVQGPSSTGLCFPVLVILITWRKIRRDADRTLITPTIHSGFKWAENLRLTADQINNPGSATHRWPFSCTGRLAWWLALVYRIMHSLPTDKWSTVVLVAPGEQTHPLCPGLILL